MAILYAVLAVSCLNIHVMCMVTVEVLYKDEPLKYCHQTKKYSFHIYCRHDVFVYSIRNDTWSVSHCFICFWFEVLLHHSSMGNVSRAPAYIGVLLSSFFFHKFAIKFDASHDDWLVHCFFDQSNCLNLKLLTHIPQSFIWLHFAVLFTTKVAHLRPCCGTDRRKF